MYLQVSAKYTSIQNLFQPKTIYLQSKNLKCIRSKFDLHHICLLFDLVHETIWFINPKVVGHG